MSEDRALENELEVTRKELARLTEQAERNSRILAQSQARELSLLRAGDLQALFQVMLEGLRDSYGLDAVTVVLCDPDHEMRHLLLAGSSSPAVPRGLFFVDDLERVSRAFRSLEAPRLGAYRPADHRSVFPGYSRAGSVALIPLREKGRLFGALNFLSRDPSRFQPHQATDFLDHLGVIAAFALENSVNRARLRRSGFTDVLTGWYNRRYLEVRLLEELARAARDSTTLTCLMLDIDHFKRVNDRYGHAAGDDVLQEMAGKIAKRIRATDVAARYGGEEFVILLPDSDSRAGVSVAESIRQTVQAGRYGAGSDLELEITVSIGVATCQPGRDDTAFKALGAELLASADRALYRAKSSGRNRVEVSP